MSKTNTKVDKVEVLWPGAKTKHFTDLEDARKFAETLTEGYDIWMNDDLVETLVVDFKTGKSEFFQYS